MLTMKSDLEAKEYLRRQENILTHPPNSFRSHMNYSYHILPHNKYRFKRFISDINNSTSQKRSIKHKKTQGNSSKYMKSIKENKLRPYVESSRNPKLLSKLHLQSKYIKSDAIKDDEFLYDEEEEEDEEEDDDKEEIGEENEDEYFKEDKLEDLDGYDSEEEDVERINSTITLLSPNETELTEMYEMDKNVMTTVNEAYEAENLETMASLFDLYQGEGNNSADAIYITPSNCVTRSVQPLLVGLTTPAPLPELFTLTDNLYVTEIPPTTFKLLKNSIKNSKKNKLVQSKKNKASYFHMNTNESNCKSHLGHSSFNGTDESSFKQPYKYTGNQKSSYFTYKRVFKPCSTIKSATQMFPKKGRLNVQTKMSQNENMKDKVLRLSTFKPYTFQDCDEDNLMLNSGVEGTTRLALDVLRGVTKLLVKGPRTKSPKQSKASKLKFWAPTVSNLEQQEIGITKKYLKPSPKSSRTNDKYKTLPELDLNNGYSRENPTMKKHKGTRKCKNKHLVTSMKSKVEHKEAEAFASSTQKNLFTFMNYDDSYSDFPQETPCKENNFTGIINNVTNESEMSERNLLPETLKLDSNTSCISELEDLRLTEDKLSKSGLPRRSHYFRDSSGKLSRRFKSNQGLIIGI